MGQSSVVAALCEYRCCYPKFCTQIEEPIAKEKFNNLMKSPPWIVLINLEPPYERQRIPLPIENYKLIVHNQFECHQALIGLWKKG
jgi:hypothetical protein